MFGPIWIILVFMSLFCWKMQSYSNSLWLHVANTLGSLKGIGWPKPRYGPSHFSLIYSPLLRDLGFRKIAAHSAYDMFSWYKYLIVGLVFSRLGFWSGNLFLIAPFPDLCLLVPFYFICYCCSWFCAVWRLLKVSLYIIHSADYIFLLVL